MAVNTNRLTEKSQESLVAAQNLAERNGNSQVEPEHLLLALLEQSEGVVPQVLSKMNIATGALVQQVRAELQRLPRVTGTGVQIGISPRLRTVLVRAHDELSQFGDEFVSTEHTPKNNMIVGTKQKKKPDSARFDEEVKAIKDFYGIKEQRLENLLETA